MMSTLNTKHMQNTIDALPPPIPPNPPTVPAATALVSAKNNIDTNITKSQIFKEILLIKNYGCRNNGSYEGYEECPICIETLHNEYVFILPCGHTFHRECILENIITHDRHECPFPNCEKGKLIYIEKKKIDYRRSK